MKSMDMTTYPGRTYRYFKGTAVFPFGWGLSYTTFSLSIDNGTSTNSTSSSGSEAVGLSSGEVSDSLNATISVVVSNDGDVAGDEVVFAFFRPVSTGATGPATLLNEQLFDYERVSLEPSESRRVSFTVGRSTLALADTDGNLVSYPGSYEILVSNGVTEREVVSVEVSGDKALVREGVQPFPLSEEMATSGSASRRDVRDRLLLMLAVFVMMGWLMLGFGGVSYK
jgi:beta-D-xylosidase 4